MPTHGAATNASLSVMQIADLVRLCAQDPAMEEAAAKQLQKKLHAHCIGHVR